MLPLIGVLAAGAVAAYFVNARQYGDKFVPGTVIDGMDVGDMSPEELAESLSEEAAGYSLTLKFLNDVTETVGSGDIDLSYDTEQELKGILDSQNHYSWITGIFGKKEDHALSTEITYSEDKLASVLLGLPELQADYVREPEDAYIKMKSDGTLTIFPEINGNQIDTGRLIEAVGEAVKERKSVLDLVAAEDIYQKPEVLSTDKELNETLESLNGILGTTVTYKLSDGTEKVLDRAETSNWLETDEEGRYTLGDDALRDRVAGYIAGIAKEDDNYGYYRTFKSTNFGTIKMATEALHGHRLDQEKMSAELLADLTSHTDASHEMTYSEVVDTKDPRFGGTYVEVDILNQHVYFYIDYELYCDGDCVTGTEGYRSTPSGIFSIQEKERGRTLEGYNSDGTVSYTAFVNYWMCFYPHYGLHDASWRDYFGGETYLYDGSHGCVNLSYYTASMIYDAIDYDTPVIIFRGQDDYEVPEDEISPDTEDVYND